MSRGPLLIVGASGRAAAASALRAGYAPFVIDLFADADTKRLCPVIHCPAGDYPTAIPVLAKQVPPGPFIYTGGLENNPAVLAALSDERVLLGIGPDVLSAVRNPFRLHELLSEKGLEHPSLNHPKLQPLPAIRWLRKPFDGSGGFGVRFATPDDIRAASDPGAVFYLQEYLPGQPMSAVYVSHGGRVFRVGLTRQLAGVSWLHAKPFRYAGNIAPVKPADSGDGDTYLHAYRLATRAGLTGLWGLDYISHAGGTYLIEVNPRYTAAVEVLEYVYQTAFLGWHADVAAGRSAAGSTLPTASRTVGKAVYYAPHRITFPGSGPWDESLATCDNVWRRPDFADIPDPGTVIEPGQPVLTAFAEGGTEDECLGRLKTRAAELDLFFGRTPTGGAGP